MELDHSLEPDPALGVFSTMLVVDGAPIALEPHLDRLAASISELYGGTLPERAAALVVEEARRQALGRLRLTFTPAGRDPLLDAVAAPIDRAILLPGRERALELRTTVVDGWRGAHKWADRRLLDACDATTAPEGALLVDPAGHVLETTRANVFAFGEDGVLRTPPADGSILPGATRAAVIALVRAAGIEAREEALDAAVLKDAREVFATGSVRGVEPVRSLDGVALGDRGEVCAALAEELRRRWLGGGGLDSPPSPRMAAIPHSAEHR